MSGMKDVINALEEKFSGKCFFEHDFKDGCLFIDIKRKHIKEISEGLIEIGGRYLVSVGYDNTAREGNFGLVHLFAFDRMSCTAALRAFAPADDPSFDSITPVIPGAGWSEREYMDLLGMKFPGHPKAKRLVLPDDWPEGIYPLRREVPHNIMPPAADAVAAKIEECPEGCTVIPVGPFHPSLHEPNHWAVFVDGETIKGCEYRGFMTHRGIEKLCATRVSYNEVPFIAERICGICGSVHATSYSQSVEKAAGINISKRAEYIRTVMLELERLHSHLLWLGVAGHLIGFDTVFMQSWRIREHVMWLCERITGNRKTYGMIVIGGVRRDITPELAADIVSVIDTIEKECLTVKKAIAGDTVIHRRTKGVGYISKEETIKWSLVGPVARARGLDIDVRKDHPYAAYPDMEFDVPVYDTCDVWGTLMVRVLEIFEAVRIIRQAIKKMPDDGPLLYKFDEEVPAFVHSLSMVEAPRGEVVHYVITGENNRAERWRVRAPTYPNLQGVPSMLMENQFADFPIILGSIDPCFSCTDRVQVLKKGDPSWVIMSSRDLEAESRKKRRC